MSAGSTVHGGNLDQQAQNGRIRMSIGMLFVSLTAVLILVAGDFPVWTRGLLFFPFFFVGFGAFQGLHQVCPSHAAKGTRTVGGCDRKVSDPCERERLERDGRTVHVESVAGALIGTALLFLLP